MGQFWLEYQADGQLQRFDFDQQTVSIGRDPTSDFHLDHPTVSRQHALIVDNRGSHQLVVLSRQGLTALDGQRVSGTVDLKAGQTLQFGEIQLRYAAPAPGGLGAPSNVPTDEVDLNQFGGDVPKPQQVQAGAPSDYPTTLNSAVPGPESNPANKTPMSQKLAAPQVDDQEDMGVKSWDQIAAEAPDTGAQQAVGGPRSDFERIQAAQARAAKQSKGTNPGLIAVAGIAIAGLLYFIFKPAPEKQTVGGGPVEEKCERMICYPEGKAPTCAGKSDCTKQAVNAYKVSEELYEKKGADIKNVYEAYKQLDKAERFLAKAGIANAPPDAMKDYQEKLQKYKTEIDENARDYRIKIHQFEQRRMFTDKAKSLLAWKAFYTDKYNKWYDEVIEKEREMRDRGTWPKRM